VPTVAITNSTPGISVVCAALASLVGLSFSISSTDALTGSPASERVSASVIAAVSIPTCRIAMRD